MAIYTPFATMDSDCSEWIQVGRVHWYEFAVTSSPKKVLPSFAVCRKSITRMVPPNKSAVSLSEPSIQ